MRRPPLSLGHPSPTRYPIRLASSSLSSASSPLLGPSHLPPYRREAPLLTDSDSFNESNLTSSRLTRVVGIEGEPELGEIEEQYQVVLVYSIMRT
jgi:hypothetical protein